MTYQKRPDINTGVAGESVVELADGSLVAVTCTQLRCTGSQSTCFESAARWIDESGVTKTDAQGHEVRTQHRHTTSDDEMAAHGDDVMRCCLYLVLGEPIPTTEVDGQPYPIVPFGDEPLKTCSIVRAIAAAKATFQTVDTADLL